MEIALALNNISRSFSGKKVLQNLSLQIPAAATCAFIGANGAGKTTTFSIIAGFLRLHGGNIRLFGWPQRSYYAHGGVVGILPQDALFFEERNIQRQLYLFARLSGYGWSAAWREVDRVLDLVSLKEMRRERAGALSHGMRVRLGVAQALIGEPPLVLLDEPTAGLDASMLVAFRNLIEGLRGQTTLVISSHDLSELQNLCNYVCIIDQGQLLKQGPMSEMLARYSAVRIKLDGFSLPLENLSHAFPALSFKLAATDTLDIKFDAKAAAISEVNKQVLQWLFLHNQRVVQVESQQSLEEAYLKTLGGK